MAGIVKKFKYRIQQNPTNFQKESSQKSSSAVIKAAYIIPIMTKYMSFFKEMIFRLEIEKIHSVWCDIMRVVQGVFMTPFTTDKLLKCERAIKGGSKQRSKPIPYLK